MRTIIKTVITTLALTLSLPVTAAPILGGIDLATFDFDVTTYNSGGGAGIGGLATASGTSNGIGWSVGPTNIWSGRLTTNGTYTFDGLIANGTDRLHTSIDFTINFDTTINTLLVALDNDGGTDSINFGRLADEVQGLDNPTGTQYLLAGGAQSGLALFHNVNSLTVTHTNTNVVDGFDIAWHAVAVPEPSIIAIFVLGLAGIGFSRRKQKA